ncbi:hypothetical protein GGI24_007049, partial [Coemansia furcata]
KRRLSEGCHSAPMSPPQTAVAAIKPLANGGATPRSKRPRSFHTPSRSESVFPQPAAGAAISLPSCASLLSMAGTSSAAFSNDSSSSPARHHMALAPIHSRHASAAFTFEMEPNSVPLPVPRGAFDASAAAFHNKQQYHRRQQEQIQFQQYRRVYHVAPTVPPLSSFHRYSISGAEFPSQSGAPVYSQSPPAQYYHAHPSSSHYSVHQ